MFSPGLYKLYQHDWRKARPIQVPAEDSGSHPFATCVCPIPVSVFHFPFFSLYGPTSFHQKSCHISPFSPAPPSVSRHTFLHFSSPLHRPFVLLHRCLSYPPCTLSFFHIIMYAHVCGCGSAASFASLQVCLPFFLFSCFPSAVFVWVPSFFRPYTRVRILQCVCLFPPVSSVIKTCFVTHLLFSVLQKSFRKSV